MTLPSQVSDLDIFAAEFPCTDEHGVDLGQIEYQLSLTPEQRLQHLQEFADFLFTAWKNRGIDWLDTERFSNV